MLDKINQSCFNGIPVSPPSIRSNLHDTYRPELWRAKLPRATVEEMCHYSYLVLRKAWHLPDYAIIATDHDKIRTASVQSVYENSLHPHKLSQARSRTLAVLKIRT